ncbi:NUDIX hydrolase [Candidatus Woesearchaeota archaeon]|nr:NUDIX hydrolase [Candidatus Woesearchaeota archaeon]
MDDVTKFPRPMVTVDIVIFSMHDHELKVLLIKRDIQPYKGGWALPGGFVHIDEDLEVAAKRELLEETGVKDVYLEQLYTFGDPKRDSRGRVITIAYFALIKSEGQRLDPKTDVSEANWFSAYQPPKLAFDHSKILEYALKRLQWKLEYTTVAFQFLQDKFTLTELQKIYETILHKKFDKRNFRKKIFALDIVEDTGDILEGMAHRPAKLYKCNKKIGELVEIL